MNSNKMITAVYFSFLPFTETLYPDGHFDMSALDRLEKVAGITLFEKLALNFMTSELDFPEPTVESLRKENNPVERSKAMMEAWLSGASFLTTTWQVHAIGKVSSC